MKKNLPFILIIVAAIGIGYSFINKPADSGQPVTVTPPTTGASQQPTTPAGDVNNQGAPAQEGVPLGQIEEEVNELEDVKPASIAYKDAESALEALKKGSLDYDDSILEQFTQPGDDCTWCAEVYSKMKDFLKSAEYKNEQKSFFAEILAISGRVENVKTLVEGFKGSQSPEEKEIFSSALELVAGKDDVVDYLGSQLNSDSADLKESMVAAMTNQGSPLALETLYKHTVANGDPDGYYQMGIGLGEMILDDASLQKAQEYVEKRDAYSPLMVKSLLNSGMNGLKIVMDVLGNSSDPEGDKRLIKDAVDHVSYDDQIEAYLKQQANSSKPLVRDFANQILQDFSQQEEPSAEDSGQLQSPVNGKPAE